MSTPKVISASHFRAKLFESLVATDRGQPHLITHNSGDPVILVSQAEYNRLLDENEVLRKISLGVVEAKKGEGFRHTDLIKKLKKMARANAPALKAKAGTSSKVNFSSKSKKSARYTTGTSV